MASASRVTKEKETHEIQLVSNEVKQPEFKPIPEVAYKNDPAGALSVIPDKVVMVQDVRRCYNCKVGAIGDLEIFNAYDKMCEDKILKDEFSIIERKGLTKPLLFPSVFKIEWVRIVLSRIHDGAFWLETGPVKFTKKTVHRVTGIPTLDRPKTLRSEKKEVIEKNTGAKWNKRGMAIDNIKEPLLDFAVRIISHKFYQSSRLNSVPCIAVDVAYKLVKKDHTYDLAELMFQQINENLGAIRKSKGAQCKFGSVLVCMFFYLMKEFPSVGKIKWNPNKTIVDQINDFIDQMGDNFDAQMTSYFEDFKQQMKQRVRIPVSLVEKHVNNICFLVDIDFTYIQAVIPRIRWLRPLGYEVDVDQASAAITALLAEEVDKKAKVFGTYDTVKSRVVTEMKAATAVKRKDTLVRKLKKKFGVGEGTAEVEEEEEEEEEGEEEEKVSAEEEEAEEAQVETQATKRKATTSPASTPKAKKVAVPSPKTKEADVSTPKRPTTRATAQKAQEQATGRKRAPKASGAEPQKKRSKSIPPSPSVIDKLCKNIRNSDLKGLKNLNFESLNKGDQNRVEEAVYAMMAEYKYTPLELDAEMPKELYKIIEDKWHFCLKMEREIRESTLARLLPDLTKEQISNAVKRHNKRFTPKNRAFSILQNKIEDIVSRSTNLWKIIYKSTEDVFNEDYKAEASARKKEIRTKRKMQVETSGEEDQAREKEKDETTSDQQDQSVQDTQLLPPSPPQATITPAESVKIKDITDTSSPNVNPLTTEDLQKLSSDTVLVSVDELQKAVDTLTKEKVNPQEPPSITQTTDLLCLPPPSPPSPPSPPGATAEQQKMPSAVTGELTATLEQPASSTPSKGQAEDRDDTSEKEESAIQALAILPTSGTPQRPSTSHQTLQLRTPGSSTSKASRILHYGDPELDEEIVIPSYDSRTISLDQINEMQEALNRRRRQEILRKEYKQKLALVEIKDIFLDAFTLQIPDESAPIMEQLAHIAEQVQDPDQEANVRLMEWSERKFQGIVNAKIASEIMKSQIELAKGIEQTKKVLENAFSLYKKLCNSSFFTQHIRQRIATLEENMNISSMTLPKDPTMSEKHFATTLQTQAELATLTTEESTIKAKLLQLQASITPYLEMLHREQVQAEIVVKKDPNLSTNEGLVHLAAETAIQHKSLDIALNKWDAALQTILEINSPFLAKYGITP